MPHEPGTLNIDGCGSPGEGGQTAKAAADALKGQSSLPSSKAADSPSKGKESTVAASPDMTKILAKIDASLAKTDLPPREREKMRQKMLKKYTDSPPADVKPEPPKGANGEEPSQIKDKMDKPLGKAEIKRSAPDELSDFLPPPSRSLNQELVSKAKKHLRFDGDMSLGTKGTSGSSVSADPPDQPKESALRAMPSKALSNAPPKAAQPPGASTTPKTTSSDSARTTASSREPPPSGLSSSSGASPHSPQSSRPNRPNGKDSESKELE
jgi:hypothetical protein